MQQALDTRTARADSGFFDSAHTIIALRISGGEERLGRGGGGYRYLYVVELSNPSLSRLSGIAGLNVEDFCALNTSLRCLIASLGEMARPGGSQPPLRDSKLTRLLSGALGAQLVRTHLLLCVSPQRQHADTTSELLSFGSLAKSAVLSSAVYEASAPRVLCSQASTLLNALPSPPHCPSVLHSSLRARCHHPPSRPSALRLPTSCLCATSL